MRGWFDFFREDGGPTLYASSNRTSVVGDVSTITLCVVFGTLYLAFFIIFPGVRKERFTTFLSVTLSLFVGTAILIGNHGSSWHLAEAEISSAYKAFSNEKIMGKLGVYVGLTHANVTLEAMPVYYNRTMDVHFNERFQWSGPTQLQEEYRSALIKGLPFPILTVAEYLAVDAEGFCWGRNYRKAGYYTSIFLWTSFVLWLCMNVLLVVVPRYGAYLMTLTGAMMLFSNAVYLWLLPARELVIHIEDATLTFQLGWCFYLILIAGCLCLMIGSSISILDLIYPHKFSTILEMDYGTPFDRHTIIEDSHETKKKKKTVPKLEEPATMGFGGLLRRLSKRDRERGMGQNPGGHDNYAFEMEAPKSPWRYPHMMFRGDSKNKSKGMAMGFNGGKRGSAGTARHLDLPPGGQHPYPEYLRRTDSKDSSASSVSSFNHGPGAIGAHNAGLREDLRAVFSVPPFQDPFKKFRRTDSSESSNSSLASFGNISQILASRSRSRQGSRKARQQKPARSQSQERSHLAAQHGIPQHMVMANAVPASSAAPPMERGDSSQSVVSRGQVAAPATTTHAGLEAGAASLQQQQSTEEVAIIVSGRKDSTTKAVSSRLHSRRNSVA